MGAAIRSNQRSLIRTRTLVRRPAASTTLTV